MLHHKLVQHFLVFNLHKTTPFETSNIQYNLLTGIFLIINISRVFSQSENKKSHIDVFFPSE